MKSLIRVAVTLVAAVIVSGCVKQMELSQVVNLSASNANYGQDIYGERRAAGETVPSVRGNQIVEIRTYEEGNTADQTTKEMAGAECLVRSDGAEAVVRSPGGVRVSLYGYRTPPLDVTCIKPNYLDATKVFPTFNATKAERLQSASAAPGLAGLLVLGAVAIANAASDETQHDFKYQMPRIMMQKGQSSGTLPVSSPVTSPSTENEQPVAETGVPTS